MNQNSSNSPAAEVWRRLAGMYGADAVARKYGQAIPDEWHAMLFKLQPHQIQRGIRMLAYSGKANVPSLPEFVKLCRDAEHDRETTNQPALPNPDGWKGDGWDIEANHHFLAYLLQRVHERRPMTADETRVFVEFKKAWARDMREGFTDSATGEILPPTIEQQKAAWKDCLERAEAATQQKAAA